MVNFTTRFNISNGLIMYLGKKYLALFIFISAFLTSCIKGHETNKIPLVEYFKTGKTDSSFFKQQLIVKNNPYYLSGETMMFSSFQGKKLFAYLSRQKAKIIILSDTLLTKVKIPFLKDIPVVSIYFHNYDSVFVFFDREFVVKNSGHNRQFSDFILIDTTGKIIDRYSLNDVPYIYKGSLNPMIVLRKLSVWHKRIRGRHFYLPFLIYRPSISDSLLGKYSIKLVCDYDLSRHSVRMLGIKIPSKDIGKTFNDGVLTNTVDVYIESDTSLLYSFVYSSDIYRYSLARGKSILIKSFPDFPFNNNDKSKFAARFMAPEYSGKRKVYLRKIYIRKMKGKNDFAMSQILDKNFNLIGYSMPDSAYDAIVMNAKGDLILKAHNQKVYSIVKLKGQRPVDFSFVEKRLPDNQNIGKTFTSVFIDKNKTDYDIRVQLYLNQLFGDSVKKVVMINTSVYCAECISFLVKKLKNNQEELLQNNIVYLFYGEDVESAKKILEKYDVLSYRSIRFDNYKYKNYLKHSELSANPFVVIGKNKTKIFTYEPQYIEKVFNDFMKW